MIRVKGSSEDHGESDTRTKWCFVKLYYRVDLAVGDVFLAMAYITGSRTQP